MTGLEHEQAEKIALLEDFHEFTAHVSQTGQGNRADNAANGPVTLLKQAISK